eukprot:symbB.v1.2.008599.t1/scaffold523.1/size192511/21
MMRMHVAFLGILAVKATTILRGPVDGDAPSPERFHSVWSRLGASLSSFFDTKDMDVQRAEGLRPGVAVRTQILSVDNGSTVQNITSFRSIQAKAPGGNVTVQIESQDVTKAKGSSAAKIIPPPPKPPNKEDFEVQIKSVERVDGKKPIRPMRNATPSVAKKKSASALDIKVWTVTDAPKARNQVPAARREYNSKLWADDWGDEWKTTAHIPPAKKKDRGEWLTWQS